MFDTTFPPVTIVMTTYFPSTDEGDNRRRMAHRAMNSWAQNLTYRGEVLLHVADDGSETQIGTCWGEDVTYSYQNQGGYGASLNAGFKKAFETSPLALHAVDDWALLQDFDITPWVYLLLQREDVGMVRLGPPHPNNRGTALMLTDAWQGWGLVLDRVGFACGLRPALFHKRFFDNYGWFEENTSALESERLYNEKFCSGTGPNIVLALPHPWEHLDSVSMSGREPK